ncbi:MAG: hypothetical protein RQ833_08865 [Sphingomonadaceae bacterium]|nr:hypothetical protein [Sphingomonadaceae bacterium]
MTGARSVLAALLTGAALVPMAASAQTTQPGTSQPSVQTTGNPTLPAQTVTPQDDPLGVSLVQPLGRQLIPSLKLNGYVDTRLTADVSRVGTTFPLYAQVQIGGSGAINRRDLQASATAFLDYLTPISGRGATDRFSVNGILRLRAEPIRKTLSIDASAYAGLLNQTYGSGFTVDQSQISPDLAQIYVLSVQPTVFHDFADRYRATASYRVSYTAIDRSLAGTGAGFGGGGGLGNTPGAFGGIAPLSNSLSQTISGSLGTVPNRGRMSLVFSGDYTFEDQERLEQRFRSYRGQADLSYRFGRRLALLGLVSYENYDNSQQAIRYATSFLTASPVNGSIPVTTDLTRNDLLIANIPGQPPGAVAIAGQYVVPFFPNRVFDLGPTPQVLLNTAGATQQTSNPLLVILPGGQLVPTGFGPLINPADGQYVPDPTLPRQTLYRQDGLVYSAGLRYTPNSRLNAEIRLGQRFQNFTINGSIYYRLRPSIVVSGQVIDGLQTYGNILTQTINGVPTSFVTGGATGGGLIGGCVIGVDIRNPSGCIGGQTQSLISGVFRDRQAVLSLDAGGPRRRVNISATYNERAYQNRGQSTGSGAPPIDPTLARRTDTRAALGSTLTLGLGQNEEISLYGGFTYQKLGLTRLPQDDVFVNGVIRYARRIIRRIDFVASGAISERIAGSAFSIGTRSTAVVSAGARVSF